MKINPDQSSRWMVEFHKQMIRCKHVLLYGNISDQFLFNDGYCTLQQFLDRYFLDEGYEIVGHYDVLDGLRFADDSRKKPAMFQQFREIVRKKMTEEHDMLTADSSNGEQVATRPDQTSVNQTLGSGHVEPVGPAAQGSAPAAGAPGAAGRQSPFAAMRGRGDATPNPADPAIPATPVPGGAPRPPQPTGGQPQPQRIGSRQLQLEPALDAIRKVLGQTEQSAAFVVHFVDKMAQSREQPTDDERKRLIQLMKLIESAAFLRTNANPRLQRRKNALVLVARQLGSIPEWLHKDCPFLSLIQVTHPRNDERTAFVHRFQDSFYDGSGMEGPERKRVADEFANLTDGMTAWDFDAILRTSVEEQLSIRDSRKLINFYKHGVIEDPWERIDAERVRQASATVQQRVIGQSHAVESVCDMLVAARVGVSMSNTERTGGKPKGVFFFVGPTGVGKTELAKALTQLIFSDESAFERFDMSEYAAEHSAERLTGAPPSFVGYEEGGQLTNRVQQRPFSLLLFDEIEKAHGRIMDKFLQILEDGRMTDGKGQTAYFSQTAIIFTSNIGSSELEKRLAGSDKLPDYEQVQDLYQSEVRKHFTYTLKRPEILNRLGDNILVFDLLRPEYIPAICNKFLGLMTKSAFAKLELRLRFPDDSICQMILGMMTPENLSFGGRRIKTLMETHIERPLNRWIFIRNPPRGAELEITADFARRSIRINREEVASHV